MQISVMAFLRRDSLDNHGGKAHRDAEEAIERLMPCEDIVWLYTDSGEIFGVY